MVAIKVRWVVPCLSMLLATSCAVPEQRPVGSEGPVTAQAREVARTVPPGTAQRVCRASAHGQCFAASSRDLLDMLDIEGASYVVKAPDSAQGVCWPEFCVQYFLDGKAVTEKFPYPDDQASGDRLGSARSWLVDILVWPDWLSSKARGFGYTIRIQPLDGDKEWFYGGRDFFEYPEDVKSKVAPIFALFQPRRHQVRIDEEVPLACYYNRSSSKQDELDPGEIARSAEVACVFYIRVRQKDDVLVEKD